MRKFLLVLISTVFFGFLGFSQNFSNKGKDFWVGYGNHVRMFGGTPAESMQIYITSDVNTSGTVTFTSGTTSIPFTVTANLITVIQIPRTEFLNDEGLYSRGIHITAVNPVVAYGFIYVGAISGATLYLPTTTLGKEYYSLNYRQLSNEANSYSYFFVEAVEPGTTQVEITPTQTTKNGWAANIPQTVNLTQGQIYQVLSPNDLTGSKIKSIAPINGDCKKIAVFCGSGKISIGCSPLASPTTATGSSDNLYQQMYPYATWGKKYITVPSVNATCPTTIPPTPCNLPTIPTVLNPNTNRFRILRPDATSVVTLNGAIIPSASFTSNYYDFSSNSTSIIESDKPIMVAQYFTTAISTGANPCPSGNSNPHDPEMIYLNPVEQTISDVTLNSMQPASNTAISQHFINVVVKNGGTGLSSFKLDGINIPASAFTVLSQDNSYSYARIWKQGGSTTTTATPLALGVHRLKGDSAFNAIAYGFGSAESYGYSAGANLKDLTNAIAIQNNLSILPITDAVACTNSPFSLKLYLQDSALTNTGPFAGQSIPVRYDSMRWNIVPVGVTYNNGQVFPYTVTPSNQETLSGIPKINFLPHYPGYIVRSDSTSLVNGKTVKWYFFPYSLNSLVPGDYVVTVTGYLTNSVADCGSSTNEKDFDFPLKVSPPPVANFSFTQPGCPNDIVTFTETTPQTPFSTYAYYWNFGEPSSASNTANTSITTHAYSNPSLNPLTDYTIKHASINAAGCRSDTVTKIITVPKLVNVALTGSTTVCINTTPPNITFTITPGLLDSLYKINYTLSINGGAPVAQTPITTFTLINQFPAPTNTAGTFVYNITSIENANPAFCIRNITGQSATVVVTPDATLSLTSAANTDAQTLCINNAITNITYSVGGSGTGGSVSGLPAGVTGTYNAGVITITGTPTVSGTFNYTVNTTGPCVKPSLTGVINITADATLVLSSAAATGSQNLCINIAINNITYAVGGSGTGGSVSGLPAGVTGTYNAGVITITGTPTVSGTFNYTVTTTGPCIKPSLTGVITVTADATLSLTSSANTATQTLCINNAITNITYAVGGSGNGGSVSGLPAGVTGTYAGGVISIAGTPTVSGTYNYTVNTTGPCIKPSLTGVINVIADATLALSTAAATASQTICINTALTNITYAVGGSATGGSVSGLPAGVTGTYNAGVITITGTPTVSGTFNYTVNTTGPCVKPSLNGVITITADATLALSSAAATNNQTLCINTLLTNITYAVGGTGTGGSVSGLPAGVTGTYSAGVITISGTPTASGTFNYTVNTTGPCVKPSLTGTITVTADATLALSSTTATTSQTICINTALTNITYAVGGTGTGGSVTGLPAGVTGTFNAGVLTIAGTPTVSGTFNYTVNTTGPCVKPSLTGVINVTPNATLALSSAASTNNQNLCINVAITNITYSVGASGTGGSVSGLPAGVTGTYAGGVITISGIPTVVGTFNYTVSTTGPCVKPSTTGVITVTPDATITLTSVAATTSQQLCKNFAINNITYQVAGGGTGAGVTGLPAGLTGVYAGGVFAISGSPTVDGTFNYTVTTTGTCVQKTATGTIVVHPIPTASYFAAAPYCAQNAVTITPTFGITPIGSVVSWVWNYGDGTGQQIRANGNPFTLTYPTAGIKPVSFKVVSDKGCESALATTPIVSINSKPKAGFKSPEACLADANADFTDTSTVVVGGPIVNWEWDFGDGTPIYTGGTTGPVNSHKNPRHAYLAVGLKTVRLIVTTASGCKDTTTQSFFINGEVTSADFLPQGNFCSNRPVKLKENSVVNVGGLIRVDIYWDNATSPTVFELDDFPTVGKIYSHSYPNLQIDKTYSVRYIAYSGFNGLCQKEVTKNIIVHASPVASFTAPINVCLNSGLVPLSGSEIGGVGGTTVFIGTGVSSTGIFDPLLVGAGVTDTVTFTAISPNGCDSAIKRPIHVLVPPVANFATVGYTCVGPSNVVTFSQSSTSTEGGAIVKWIYDWGDGSAPQTFTSAATPITHAYATAGPKTAYLIVETAFGCRNAAPGKAFSFTVNPLPVPDYNFTTSACLPNANIVFTNLTPSIGSNSYVWYFELPSTAAANTSTSNGNPSHIYTVLGPHDTKLIATNTTTGCKDSTTVRVVNTIHPAPVVTFGAMLDICLNNGTRTLTQGNQSYPGMIGTGVYSGPGVTAGVFNPIVAGVGTHTLTYTFTSTFNCTSFATSTIKVLAPPVVDSFKTVGNRCERNDIVFANFTTSTAGVVASWIYNWGDASGIQTNTSSANTNHQYALAGSYPATLTLVTDYGCNSSPAFPLQVVVNPIPKPNFTYSDTACLPVASILFKNTTPSIGNWIYNWNFDVPSTATLDNSLAVSNITHLYYTQAPHNVRLIATSTSTGCKDSIFKPILTIHPAPNASFAFTKPSVCIGDFVGIIDQSTFADGVANKWEWKWGDGGISASANPGTHTYNTATDYNVSLKITNSWGCIDDTIMPFTVHPFPVVNAGKDSVILQGGSLVLTPTVSGNNLTYLWDGTPGPINLSSTVVQNPVASPREDITYKLTVTGRGGCAASDFVFIKVLKDPVVPNTFTPNNDGVHDTWVIKYLESYPDNRIQVFTRAGQLVYESKKYLVPWDGTVNGKSLPIDTYYYILEPGSGRKPLTGFVTIIK